MIKYKCPLCGKDNIKNLFRWKDMPINGNAIFESKRAAEKCICTDLEMSQCSHCGFVFNPVFNNKFDDELYSRKYSVNRSASNVYQDYLLDTLDFIIDNVKSLKTVVDVGCGDEYFLSCLKKRVNDINAIGYDPSLNKSSRIKEINLVKDYYGEKYLDDEADLITCRQVIEHIPDPYTILDTFALAGKRKRTYLYIETPDIEYIFQKNMFDFYYEHCSYYSQNSLTYLLNKCGFKVIVFDKKFGQQYLNFIAVSDKICADEKGQKFDHNEDIGLKMNNAYHRICSFLNNKKADGKSIYAWGGSAKGTIYANLFDPDRVYFDYFVDVNPVKRNTYIPKTAHLIIGIEDVIKKKPDIVFLTNGIYKRDVEEALKSCVCDIVCVEEFFD